MYAKAIFLMYFYLSLFSVIFLLYICDINNN